MKKRLLALFLAALMVVSLLPTVAFAGEVTDCTYTQKVTTPEDGKTYGLKLNGKEQGEVTLAAKDGGWNIKNSDGKYLNAENGKLVLGDTAATAWTYRNGAFSVSEKTTQKSGGHWFLFWYVPGRGTKTVTTTYYLSTVTNGAKLSTCSVCAELYTMAAGTHEYKYVNKCNGTHDKICKNCGEKTNEPCVYDQEGNKCICGAYDPAKADVKISVDVKEKATKQSVGILGWLFGRYKTVTIYTATIKTVATGVKVTKVQYQLNGSSKWMTGSNVFSNKPIEKLNIRVLDSNNKWYTYEWPEAEDTGFTVTFASVEHGAVYDAATSGNKVTEPISVASGTTVATDGNKITIGDKDYYAVADSGYEFKEFSATVPETITAATTITPVFEETVTPKFSTIADILPADFPSGDATEEDTEVIAPTGAWKTSSGAYAAAIINYPFTGDPTELDFINVGDVYDRIGLQPDTSLIKVNDSTYKVTDPKFELTFTLEAGELKKINFTAIEERWEEYNGDYTAPAPKFTVTFASAEHGAIYDAATSGEKVTEITVDSGSAVAVDGNKITIGGTDYYAIADSGYEFKEFSATVPETITAATTITPVFEAAPTFNTVADILATVTNFPSGEWSAPDNAWKNLNGHKLYKDIGLEELCTDEYDSVELTQSVTSSGTNWTCSSYGTTFTFNMTSGVLESVTVSGSGSADRTYYAEIETLQNIIGTDFPTTANTGWKCNGQTDGYSMYIRKPNAALYIKYGPRMIAPISQLSSYAGKINGGYECKTAGGGFLLHFNIPDDKLVSIEIVSPEVVAGTYTPADPADIQTIEDIVLWAAEYPLDEHDWNGSETNNTMYLSAGVLNLDSGASFWCVDPDEKVAISGGNYVWSDKDTDGTITFNMTNGVLTSITVAGFDDNRANSNDTYNPPAK